jgi:3-hydroxyacyl-CoA dehydrogenase/enoyl-CoA hydratase/3-hydroxybutyryl-CoA epimerase
MNLKHWSLRRDADGIAWATLDKADASTNVLSAEVMAELAQVLDECDREPPRALIFRSGKEAGFIAGADIGEFDMIATSEGVRELVGRGWNLYNRLAAVPYVTLALVRGHCMGGGTELALACRLVLVVDEPGTKLGLPEVMLGIFPGWGGMLRLPQRVGAPAALDMMLTGKTVDAKRAKRMGLADECVPPRVMEAAARMLALDPPPRRKLPFVQRLLTGPLKSVVAAKARKQVASRARPEHYPAPYAIIDIWAQHGGNALAAPQLLDAIARNPAAKNLVRVFRLQDRLKGFGKDSDFAPKRVHVVGAGTMGGDIAAWCAQRGMTVTLQDQDIGRIAPAIARAAAELKRRRRDRLEIQAVMDRLIPDPSGHGVAQADVVIEAIFEDLEAKHTLFRNIEPRMKPDAVLASNTSSLKIEDLRTVLADPSRLVGIHFFNPVAKMPLVEVVAAAGADEAMVKRACAFVRKIDKLPLPVKSAPGFLVNAVLAPYLHEAMHCVDAGIAPDAVDAAALAFGMPMGPIELIDTVGLDIALAAGTQLAGAAEPPRCLAERVARGELGKKSGKGFYRWENGKAQKVGAGDTPIGLAERLLNPLIERTAALVEEGVVADADLADAGVIFGTGFAPFTGGPLNYRKTATG